MIPGPATAQSGGLRSIYVINKRNRDFSVNRRRARRAETTKEEREEVSATAIYAVVASSQSATALIQEDSDHLHKKYVNHRLLVPQPRINFA